MSPHKQVQFSMKRFLILLKSHRHVLIGCSLLIGLATTFQALTDVPFFISESKLQLQPFDVGKAVDDRASIANDVFSESIRLNSSLLILQSEAFLTELARQLQNNTEKDKLILSWGIGKKLRLSYAFYRLGLSEVKFQRVDTSQLNLQELGALLGKMIQVTPIPLEQTIEIKVSALDEETALLINRFVLSAFVRASQDIEKAEFDRSISYLSTQAEAAKERLEASEQKLADYLRQHLNLSTDSATSSYVSGFLSLRTRRQELENSISADRALLEHLNQKLKTLENTEESPAEILDTLRRELLQLKYQKAKLTEQGYKEDHPGMIALNRKIEASEEFIKRSTAGKALDVGAIFGAADYRKTVAGKAIQTQESVEKQLLELRGVQSQLEQMETEVHDLPSNELSANSMRREVARAAELFNDITRRLELMRIRSEAASGTLREVTLPNGLITPNSLPTLPKCLFGFVVGFFLGISIVLLMDTLKPRVVIRSDVEGNGLKFAGLFNCSRDSCAEILAAIECIFSNNGSQPPKTPIVLCSSPSPFLTLHDFVPLVDYMASRNEHVLFVAEDESYIPTGYSEVSQIENVKIYKFPDGKKDLLHISGAESFGVLRLILQNYSSHYAAVFIFISRRSNSSIYSLCRMIANRILIFGESASHTVEEYNELYQGFPNVDEVYTALLPYKGLHEGPILHYFKKKLFSRSKSGAEDASI